MSFIPKTIYYCWFGGEKPQSVLECISNWQEKLPNYQIIEINECNKELFDVEKECQKNLWFRTVWENKMWAYVADYSRLKVLYEKGGVYFDTDITVEKDITELLEKNKLVVGWEDSKSINFAVVITNEHNPIIKEMLEFYDDEIWHSNIYTIPHISTKIIRKNYNLKSSDNITENNDILVLPPKYFYPLPIGLKEAKEFVNNNTYTIHWWNASWTKSNIDYFMRNKHKIPLDKLLNMCFQNKILIDSKFITIKKIFLNFSINIDFYYFCRFKYRYYGKNKYLTVIIMGIQIPLLNFGGNR